MTADKTLSPLNFRLWEALTALGGTQVEKHWFGPVIRFSRNWDLINIHDFLTIIINRMQYLLSFFSIINLYIIRAGFYVDWLLAGSGSCQQPVEINA
jgi:hypothetical protein